MTSGSEQATLMEDAVDGTLLEDPHMTRSDDCHITLSDRMERLPPYLFGSINRLKDEKNAVRGLISSTWRWGILRIRLPHPSWTNCVKSFRIRATTAIRPPRAFITCGEKWPNTMPTIGASSWNPNVR